MKNRNLEKDYLSGILAGNRKDLAKAITLIESNLENDQLIADKLLNEIIPFTANSVRIGISGPPGVGKSSLIEVFGSYLTSIGKKVAVIAVDPSSAITKGSILADKTRMEGLANNNLAFIRPSPSRLYLGGANADTRKVILLCESAGFEIILIETVGVGQSETQVHDMVDYFLLLSLAGSGDELQVIKKGIMEMADGILITKADGYNIENAKLAKKEISSAIHNLLHHEIMVDIFSINDIDYTQSLWKKITHFIEYQRKNGLFDENRNKQNILWLHELIKAKIVKEFYNDKNNIELIEKIESIIRDKKVLPNTVMGQLFIN